MRLLLFLAILPSVLLAKRVLAYDRIEKEPPRLLARLFGLGMLCCIPAAIIEGVGDALISSLTSSERLVSMLTYLALVPLAEEGMKYLALRTVRTNSEFNYTFDAIVYGVMVGLGFATLENVLYVFEFQSISTAVMRGILSVPLHCTCGVFMGYYFGVMRGQEVRGEASEARKARNMALLIPWFIHGIYDFSLDVEFDLAIVLGLLFTIAVFVMASRQVRVASANDRPIMVSFSTLVEPIPEERKAAGAWSNKGTPPPPFNR